MKLTLSLSDLESGTSYQRGDEDRINELKHLCMREELVAIHPLTDRAGQKRYSVIVLSDFSPPQKSAIKIKFQPLWNKTFTLCSSNKHTIIALVIELEDGTKFWIDQESVKEAKLTTSGDGTDPKVIESSETILSDILDDRNTNLVVHRAAQFLRLRFHVVH